VKHYVSAYWCQSGTEPWNTSAPKVEDDAYPFYSEMFIVNMEGEAIEKVYSDSADIQTILIPKNWRKYVNTGKKEEA
jgi:hypothetical protein